MLDEIDPTTLDPSVLRLLEGLSLGSYTVPLDGREVTLVVRPHIDPAQWDQPFTPQARARRYELLQKQADRVISPEEQVELIELELWFERAPSVSD